MPKWCVIVQHQSTYQSWSGCVWLWHVITHVSKPCLLHLNEGDPPKIYKSSQPDPFHHHHNRQTIGIYPEWQDSEGCHTEAGPVFPRLSVHSGISDKMQLGRVLSTTERAQVYYQWPSQNSTWSDTTHWWTIQAQICTEGHWDSKCYTEGPVNQWLAPMYGAYLTGCHESSSQKWECDGTWPGHVKWIVILQGLCKGKGNM